MGTKRNQHSAQFKAQVAMAALAGDKTLAELASGYGVHSTMISGWKQELVKNAKDLFERGNKKADDPQAVIDNLHRKIGQLQVERDFLAGQPAIARLLKGVQ
jgi:transposase